MHGEMVIVARCQQLMLWLLPQTERFPRQYRASITRRLVDALFDFAEGLQDAQTLRGRRRLAVLQDCDRALQRVRFHLRLAQEMRWLSLGQYEHVSRMVAELGRLLGAWLKREEARSPAPPME